MEPTPLGPESTPSHEDDGVNKLMADLERILQELRAYNKRPLPATEEQVKKLIQNEKERPILVPAEKVVEKLIGKTEDLVIKFQSIYNEFITLLNGQTRMLRQELTTQAAAMQASAAAVQTAARAVQAAAGEVGAAGEKLPRTLPVEGEVFGFTNWKTAIGTVLVSALFGALSLAALSSKVSKEDYEQLKAKERQAVRTNEVVFGEGRYYMGQIIQYKARNPKTKDFPAYKPTE